MNKRLQTAGMLLIGILLLVGGIGSPTVAQEHDHEHDGGHAETPMESTPDAYSIDVSTHPAAADIVPDSDPVELMFNVTHDGEAAEEVELSYRVYAPAQPFWFRTDFPAVEGTQLLSGTVYLPEGSQTIQAILPIRGTYRVKAAVRGPEGTARETVRFPVSENPQEKVNLAILLVGLFLFGGIGGFFIGRTRVGSTVNGLFLAALLGAAGFALAQPAAVQAHGEGDWDPHVLEEQIGVETVSDRHQYEVEMFPQPVEVGDMLRVEYRVWEESPVHAHEDQAHEEGSDHAHANEANSDDEHEHEHAEEAGHEEHDHGTDDQHDHADEDGGMEESSHGHGSKYLAESYFVHSEGGLGMVSQQTWLREGEGTIQVQLFDGAPHYLVTRFYRPTERYGAAGGHGHDHAHGEETEESDHEEEGTPPWEAELVVELEEGSHRIQFQQSGDPSMNWLLLPAGTDHVEETARSRMESCESVDAGSTVPSEPQCFNLALNPDGTSFTFDVEEPGRYRLFTQHLPREFNLTIEDPDGSVVQPERQFITGMGEYLGRHVTTVPVQPIQPPLDSIVKSMLTLLAVVGLGTLVGYKGAGWTAR